MSKLFSKRSSFLYTRIAPRKNYVNSNAAQKRSSSVPPFEKVDLTEIRKEFRKFEGGRVFLNKDDNTGIAFICLDHPEKKNGFSGSMMVDLNEAITSLESWESGKALILHSSGDTFCSGGYLDTVKKISNPTSGFRMSSLMHDSLNRLTNLPLVSLSLVNGQAIGGGAELMLFTDFRLFSSSAQCRFVEAKMGVGTGWGGGTLLRRLVGPSRALELLLTCRKVGAEEALKLGLADGIININQDSNFNLVDEGVKWISALVAQHESSIVRSVKQIVACDQLEEEKRIFATTWGGPAQLRALSSNIKHNK